MSWQMEKYLYKWLGSHAKSALPTQKRRRAEVSSLKLVCNGPWPSFTASVTRSINDPAPRTAIRCQPCRYDRRAEWVPFTYLPTWFRRYRNSHSYTYSTNFHVSQYQQRSRRASQTQWQAQNMFSMGSCESFADMNCVLGIGIKIFQSMAHRLEWNKGRIKIKFKTFETKLNQCMRLVV